MQTKIKSLIESVTNTVVGITMSFFIQIIIYPILDIDVNLNQNVIITIVFTIASIFRSYAIRRLFNRQSIKSAT
jgi:hypothetical protein